MKSYSDFKSKQFEKLIRNLERCERQINYIKKVDKYVYKGLVGGAKTQLPKNLQLQTAAEQTAATAIAEQQPSQPSQTQTQTATAIAEQQQQPSQQTAAETATTPETAGEAGLTLQNQPVNTDDEIAALLGEIDDPEFVKQDELKDIQDFNFSSLDDLAVTIQGLLEAARTTAKGNKSVLEGRIIKLEDIKNKLSKKILAMKENKLTANQNYIKLKESYTKVRKQLLDANNKLTSINTSFAAIN